MRRSPKEEPNFLRISEENRGFYTRFQELQLLFRSSDDVNLGVRTEPTFVPTESDLISIRAFLDNMMGDGYAPELILSWAASVLNPDEWLVIGQHLETQLEAQKDLAQFEAGLLREFQVKLEGVLESLIPSLKTQVEAGKLTEQEALDMLDSMITQIKNNTSAFDWYGMLYELWTGDRSRAAEPKTE